MTALDFPQLSSWLSSFRMDSELLYSLENVMFNIPEVPSDFTEIVTQWMSEHQDYVAGLTS